MRSAASRSSDSRRSVRRGDRLDHVGRRGGVAGDAIEPELAVALAPGSSRAAATRSATSAEPSRGGGCSRSAAGDRRHVDRQIEAVEQRPRQPRLILGDAARIGAAAAGVAGFVGVAAAARVHRRDQLEAGGIDDAMVGAGDRHFAGLERLAQAVERLRVELGQFVEKQHAVMGERDLARPGVDAAADQRRHRRRMVRGAERPAIGQARRRRACRRPNGSSTLRAARAAAAAAGSTAAAAPASTCPRPARRTSADCGRRRRRLRARAWRSPGP